MLPPIAFSFQMPHHADRPTKVCPVCGRPFQWRKKWKDVWEEVRYCSDRCRNQGKRMASTEDSLLRPDLGTECGRPLLMGRSTPSCAFSTGAYTRAEAHGM